MELIIVSEKPLTDWSCDFFFKSCNLKAGNIGQEQDYTAEEEATAQRFPTGLELEARVSPSLQYAILQYSLLIL